MSIWDTFAPFSVQGDFGVIRFACLKMACYSFLVSDYVRE